MKQTIIVSIEPSTRLSELCGFPYFIEKRFPLKELLEQQVIDKADIKEMRLGKRLYKRLPLKG